MDTHHAEKSSSNRKNSDKNFEDCKKVNKQKLSNVSKEWTKKRIVKNLLILSFSFLLLFTGYNGISNLQSTMNNRGGIGVASQAIIYAAFCISALLLPKMAIKNLGCNMTLSLSFLSYCPYIAANFYPNWYDMVPTSVLLGTSASTIWSAKCTYLNNLSRLYFLNVKTESIESVTALFFGASGMIYMSTQVWGNFISYFVLQIDLDPYVNTSSIAFNKTVVPCGMDFIYGESKSSTANFVRLSDHLRQILTVIYLICGLMSVMLVTCFLDKLPDSNDGIPSGRKRSTVEFLMATFKHMRKPQQIFLIPLSFDVGTMQGFYLGDFTEAYVACSWGIYHVGLVSLCSGTAGALSSGLSGRLVKYFGRPIVFAAAAVAHIIVFILLFHWKPSSALPSVFIFMGAAWGFIIGTVWSQIRAFYGLLFSEDEEAAFANYSLWSSLGYCLSFSYSNYLCTATKVYVLITIFTLGMCGYVLAEMNFRRSQHLKKNSQKLNDDENANDVNTYL